MNLVDKRSIHRLAAPPVTMELKDEEKKKVELTAKPQDQAS